MSKTAKYNSKDNADQQHLIKIIKDGKTVFTSDPMDQPTAGDLATDLMNSMQPGNKVLSATITVGPDPTDASNKDNQDYDLDALLAGLKDDSAIAA